MRTVHWYSLLIAVAIAFSTMPASAATRTVCYTIKLWGVRDRCPTSGFGVRESCNSTAGGSVDALGLKIRLYDKDTGTGASDDYIGTWIIAGTGKRCVTFEWEGGSYYEGEANPDVYIQTWNHMTDTGNSGASFDIVQLDNSDYPDTWWRDGETGDPDRYVAVNCATGASCDIAYTLLPDNSATNYSRALLGENSARHTLEQWPTYFGTSFIKVEYPTDFPNCPTACAADRTHIYVPTGGLIDEGDRLSHEAGHVLQYHTFSQDDLVEDCTKVCPTPTTCTTGGAFAWDTDTDEFDSCAVVEGWATYAAGVSWWDPNNSSSLPEYAGEDLEEATPLFPTCGDNRGRPLQSAKAFWDLDDANNEAGAGGISTDDENSMTTAYMANTWTLFANGTANRQNDESDIHGVNLRDYDFYRTGINNTLLFHNCVGAQDNN